MLGHNNHPDGIKSRISFIVSIVTVVVVALFGVIGYFGRADFTPLFINQCLNLAPTVEKHLIESGVLCQTLIKMNNKLAEVEKIQKNIIDIENRMKNQLTDIDTVYFKKFVFTTNRLNGPLPDRGLYFYANKDQAVTIKFFCNDPCDQLHYDIALNNRFLDNPAPHYNAANSSMTIPVTGKSLNNRNSRGSLDKEYLHGTPTGQWEGCTKNLKITPHKYQEEIEKEKTKFNMKPGKRYELLCWVFVRHAGVEHVPSY